MKSFPKLNLQTGSNQSVDQAPADTGKLPLPFGTINLKLIIEAR